MWSDLGEYILNQCNTNNVDKSIDNSNGNNNILDNNIENNNNNSLDNNKNNNIFDINICSSYKVVEIAIGKFFAVANYLNNPDNYTNFNYNSIYFIGIDIAPANSDVIFDDITNPNMDIYEGANVIYSIRPPQELQPYIANIVNKTGATLIIKPLFNEDLNLNLDMKLVNYKKAVFYQSK